MNDRTLCLLIGIGLIGCLGGCGELEPSRPKARKMEPDRKRTHSAPSGSTTTHNRPKTSAAAGPVDVASAETVLRNPASGAGPVQKALTLIGRDAARGRSLAKALLGASEPKLRGRGARLLGRIGTPADDGATLERLLKTDGSTEVLLGALEGIGRMNAYRSIPAVIDMMEHSREPVRRAAHQAITQMSGFEHPFDPAGSEQTRKRQVNRYRNTVTTIRGRAASRYKSEHGRFGY
ncbi:MAG: HEAT repeat domain-containing protein [Phycisphaeraceae bacterium]|nr:HEAT repeat domain-containing protein [Phycisphaeraceae bacterium]